MTALVVLDLLEDFFDEGLWPESVLPAARASLAERTNQLTGACRAAGVPVIWVRQEFRADLTDAFPHMRRQDRRYTIAGTAGCQILRELQVHPADTVMLKTRFSAFFRTGLEDMLKTQGIQNLILAGITTAWCVRSTAVDAYQRDINVIVAADCVASFTAEDHANSVKAMDGYIASFQTNGEIIPWLAGDGENNSRPG